MCNEEDLNTLYYVDAAPVRVQLYIHGTPTLGSFQLGPRSRRSGYPSQGETPQVAGLGSSGGFWFCRFFKVQSQRLSFIQFELVHFRARTHTKSLSRLRDCVWSIRSLLLAAQCAPLLPPPLADHALLLRAVSVIQRAWFWHVHRCILPGFDASSGHVAVTPSGTRLPASGKRVRRGPTERSWDQMLHVEGRGGESFLLMPPPFRFVIQLPSDDPIENGMLPGRAGLLGGVGTCTSSRRSSDPTFAYVGVSGRQPPTD